MNQVDIERLIEEIKAAGRQVLKLDGQNGWRALGVLLNLEEDESLSRALGMLDLTLPLSPQAWETLEELQRLCHARERDLLKTCLTDQLTGLYNFQHFTAQLDVEVSRVLRTQHPLSVIMLDLDGFKMVNDTLGHQTGNEVLAAVAQVLLDNIRATDLAARYGGDEFAILLPQTSAARALPLAERIRARLAAHKLCNELKVTGSFGLSCFRYLDREDPAQVIEHADQAMYQAKRAGGNQVRVWAADQEKDRGAEVTSEEKGALLKGLDFS